MMRSIVSWNIANANGLLGRKTDDPEFVNIINGSEIICLQETGDEVQLPGYQSFSHLRGQGKAAVSQPLFEVILLLTTKISTSPSLKVP